MAILPQWDKKRKYECVGSVKYGGIQTGSSSWKSGSLVVYHNGSHWKLDLHYNTSSSCILSNILSPGTIERVICKSRLVLNMRQSSTKDHVAVMFTPLNARDSKQPMETVARLLSDILEGKLEAGEINTPSEVSTKENIKQEFSPLTKLKTPPRQTDSESNCIQMWRESGVNKRPTLPRPSPTNHSPSRPRLSFKPRLLSDQKMYTWAQKSSPGFTYQKKKVESPSQESSEVSLPGFSNLGNTCYMNAVLQCLFALDSFKQDLMMCGRRMTKLQSPHSLYHALCKLLSHHRRTLPDPVHRDFLKAVKGAISKVAPHFADSQQHDAHEFLGLVLDQIKEEVLKVHKSTPSPQKLNPVENLPSQQSGINPIVNNFMMQVEHTITCKRCKEAMKKEEEFYDISVDLPSNSSNDQPASLQNALEQFFQEETIQCKCEKCGHQQSQVSHKFLQLPRVLIVHLKRYSYNQTVAKNAKVRQNVMIPRYLTLTNHCDLDTAEPPLLPKLNRSRSNSLSQRSEDRPAHSRQLQMEDRPKRRRSFSECTTETSPTTPKKPYMDGGGENEVIDLSTSSASSSSSSSGDKDLERALELSLQEAKAKQYEMEEEEEEDEDLMKALELSLLEVNNNNNGLGSNCNDTQSANDREREEADLQRALEMSCEGLDNGSGPVNFDLSSYDDVPHNAAVVTEQVPHVDFVDWSKKDNYESVDWSKNDNSEFVDWSKNDNSENVDWTKKDNSESQTIPISESSDSAVEDVKSSRSEDDQGSRSPSPGPSPSTPTSNDRNLAGLVAISATCPVSRSNSSSQVPSPKSARNPFRAGGAEKTGPKKSRVHLLKSFEAVKPTEDKPSESDYFSMDDEEDDLMLLSMDDKENRDPALMAKSHNSDVSDQKESPPLLPVLENENGFLPHSYKLVGVVSHLGFTAIAGHYICDLFDVKEKAWFSCDDTKVAKTTEDFVRSHRQRSGYIFFYLNKNLMEQISSEGQS